MKNTGLTKIVLTIMMLSLSTASMAADDYFRKSNTITSTRTSIQKDKNRITKKSSFLDLFDSKSSMDDAAKSHSETRTSSIAYPTGRISSSNLLIEKMYPSVIRLGKPYEYTIEVTNLTDLTLNDVKISEMIPDGFEIVSAEPTISSRSGKNANWNLGSIKPNDSRKILVSGKASSQKDLPCCTTADYGLPSLCHTSDVVKPAIELKVNAKKETTLCEQIPVDYTVTNSGDSLLTNVMIKGNLPSGTTTLDNKSQVNLKVGTLGAGQSRTLPIMVKAAKTGSYSFGGEATSDDLSTTASKVSTRVIQPELLIGIEVDKSKEYIGRSLTYDIEVENIGNASAQSTYIEATIPATAKFQSATMDGRASGRTVRWNLGTLKEEESKKVSMKVMGTGAGEALARAQVKAVCAEPAAETVASRFDGIPALLLEVVDVEDPIQLGETETYTIRVTNQGTADATNVKIAATLEGMKYISGTGETSGIYSNDKVQFSPVKVLKPGQRAEWNVRATGQKEGDLRFTVALDSDQLTRSVDETESTFVY